MNIKVKNNFFFFYMSEGMENYKMSRKNQEKVREFRNLKLNGYGRQSSENLFILFKRARGEMYMLMR